jgi:hypothetical protein
LTYGHEVTIHDICCEKETMVALTSYRDKTSNGESPPAACLLSKKEKEKETLSDIL